MKTSLLLFFVLIFSISAFSQDIFSAARENDTIALVGATGNAAGKPPHLHYTIKTLFPYFWLADKSVQGWRKMFYLNPVTYLNESLAKN